MRNLIILLLITSMLFAFFGCGVNNKTTLGHGTNESDQISQDSYDEDNVVSIGLEIMHYSSLEALLNDFNLLRTGDASDYLVEIAKRLDFASLRYLYIPTGITESYEIYDIAIGIDYVNISYLPKEHLSSVSTRFDAELAHQNYVFTFTRVIYENPLAGVMEQFSVNEESLIGGKLLLLKPNSLTWGVNGSMLHLYLPLPPDSAPGDIFTVLIDDVLQSLGLNDRIDLLRFTEIEIINLHS